MALHISAWYDLREHLQEQADRLASIQAETQHPLLAEAIEANSILQKRMAELCIDHGITLEED